MVKQSLTKNLVNNRLATVELALSMLTNDYEQATYRKNQLVFGCLKSASEELEAAFAEYLNSNLQRAFDLAAVAWLHCDFGRQLLDAEAIEHLLGESDYLELGELRISWHVRAKKEFQMLEQELESFRLDIAASSGSR